jgi:hypothetical protein
MHARFRNVLREHQECLWLGLRVDSWPW